MPTRSVVPRCQAGCGGPDLGESSTPPRLKAMLLLVNNLPLRGYQMELQTSHPIRAEIEERENFKNTLQLEKI